MHWKKFVTTIWNPIIGKATILNFVATTAILVSSLSVVNIRATRCGRNSATTHP